MLLVGVFILALVQGSWSQCCPPKQWEGVMNYFSASSTNGQGTLAVGRQQISYDATAQRINIQGMDFTYNIESRTIQDFANRKQYVIYNGTCTISTLPAFKENCIPNDAMLTGSTFIGVLPNKIDITTYEFMDNEGRNISASIGTGCVPIEAHIASGPSGQDQGTFTTLLYSGITAGIKDTSVFIPPAICYKQRLPAGYGIEFAEMCRFAQMSLTC